MKMSNVVISEHYGEGNLSDRSAVVSQRSDWEGREYYAVDLFNKDGYVNTIKLDDKSNYYAEDAAENYVSGIGPFGFPPLE